MMWNTIREFWTFLDVQFLDEIIAYLNQSNLIMCLREHHSLISKYSTTTLEDCQEKKIKLPRKSCLLKMSFKSNQKVYSLKKILQSKDYLKQLGVDRSLFEGFTVSSVVLYFSISPSSASHLLSIVPDHIFALQSYGMSHIGIHGHWDIDIGSGRIEYYWAPEQQVHHPNDRTEEGAYLTLQREMEDSGTEPSEKLLKVEIQSLATDSEGKGSFVQKPSLTEQTVKDELELKRSMEALNIVTLSDEVDILKKALQEEKDTVGILLEKVAELVEQKDSLTRELFALSLTSTAQTGSVVTEFSSLLSSNEGRGDYGSLEGTGSSVTASANSSSSNTTSIVDFETKSKVAEIDLESRHPSSRDSTRVVHLPPGKYEFTSGPEGKKFGIYTDYVGQSAEQSTLRDVSHLPDHIEEIVPISIANLLDFVDSMAGCWERIGIKLGLEDKVDELKQAKTNLIILLEAWLQNKRGVSWGRLIHILESSEVDLGTVAANIKDFLFKQVPVIPDNIDFLVPMSVPNLMHLVASFAQHWETIGQLLKLEEEVEKLKKAPYTSYVKMTLLLESWATLEQEFSWLNLLEKCEGRHELRPLVADIRQHLLRKMRKLYKPTSAGKD